ncbi:unnamed protein product [Gulo gulo]|uniref:Uncharacterized protein n=1 Tax=Gulo gulo TaxID=48420 RepID=A0A9X9Q278_GULGU|nr:unnamed protein product [Gulo gulo]
MEYLHRRSHGKRLYPSSNPRLSLNPGGEGGEGSQRPDQNPHPDDGTCPLPHRA